MKTTTWHIQTEDALHTVVYTFARLRGRITVTVNDDTFALPAGFLGLAAARREPFRLVGADGEPEQAILTVDKQGHATLLFRAKIVEPSGK